ncbi:MAG: HAD-IIIA family hydrolase [Candidatus Gastranaerophilales bacterium]|nr:HAD-IIIA family hydrolase [Candidatus Gastranaerophilales bacterium]
MNQAELNRAAAKIKAAIFDVDGVMTDGSMIMDQDGKEYKIFNAKDGQGLVMLNKAGIKTIVITAKESFMVQKRFEALNFTRIYQGQKNKERALNEVIEEFELKFDEISYMGDDLPDLCVLRKVGLPACPHDAVPEVIKAARFITSKDGGRGAVRELCDLILKNKD